MVPALCEFAEGLGMNAERLRGAVNRTVELMRQLKVETIDELAYRLHHCTAVDTSLSLSEQTKLRYRQMNEAKVSVAALFHSLESQAAASGLKSYHSFLHRIFPSVSGGNYLKQLECSPARVLSFNYDRLFEIAFLQHFAVDPNYALYYEYGLNSGLTPIQNTMVKFFDGRFSFLKLHGSVGMVAEDAHGDVYHGHLKPCVDGAFEVTDAAFFTRDTQKSITDQPRSPLIYFPHEKTTLLSEQQAGSPNRVYAREVWKQAAVIAAQAAEITLIGYSVCETDFAYVLPLLRSATNCAQIVIQNPDADRICEMLSVRAPDLGPKLKAHCSQF